MEKGQDCAEIKVVISDSEQRLVKKHLIYHSGFQVSKDSEFLKDLVKDTRADFKGTPEKITVNITILWE